MMRPRWLQPPADPGDGIPDGLLGVLAVVTVGLLILALMMPAGWGSPPLFGIR